MANGTNTFRTRSVLSIVTGRFFCTLSELHHVIETMCGEPIWTHQFPRVIVEIKAAMLKQLPPLAVIADLAHTVTDKNYAPILAEWVRQLGPDLEFAPMTEDEHERIDPISELAEKVPLSHNEIIFLHGWMINPA